MAEREAAKMKAAMVRNLGEDGTRNGPGVGKPSLWVGVVIVVVGRSDQDQGCSVLFWGRRWGWGCRRGHGRRCEKVPRGRSRIDGIVVVRIDQVSGSVMGRSSVKTEGHCVSVVGGDGRVLCVVGIVGIVGVVGVGQRVKGSWFVRTGRVRGRGVCHWGSCRWQHHQNDGDVVGDDEGEVKESSQRSTRWPITC